MELQVDILYGTMISMMSQHVFSYFLHMFAL